MVGVPNHTGALAIGPPAIGAKHRTIPRVVVATAIDTFLRKSKPFVFSTSTIAPAYETPRHFPPPVFLVRRWSVTANGGANLLNMSVVGKKN